MADKTYQQISPVRSSLFAASVLISATLLLSPQLALAQFTQQGPELVGRRQHRHRGRA
jgi:hypothetical protein